MSEKLKYEVCKKIFVIIPLIYLFNKLMVQWEMYNWRDYAIFWVNRVKKRDTFPLRQNSSRYFVSKLWKIKVYLINYIKTKRNTIFNVDSIKYIKRTTYCVYSKTSGECSFYHITEYTLIKKHKHKLYFT